MSRRGIALTLILLPAAMSISSTLLGQKQTEAARLDMALDKQTYHPGETVIVTYRITNLSNALLCFLPPSVDCYSIDGELGSHATLLQGHLRPHGLNGGCAADHFVFGDLGADIDKNWIKLGAHQSYQITQKSKSIDLSDAGQWLIEAGYVPMREDAVSLYQSALKDRGCTLLPELHSKKTEISVQAASH